MISFATLIRILAEGADCHPAAAPSCATGSTSEWSAVVRKRKRRGEQCVDAFASSLAAHAKRFAFDLAMVACGARPGFLVDYCDCAALDALMFNRIVAAQRLAHLIAALHDAMVPPRPRLCAVVLEGRHLFFVNPSALHAGESGAGALIDVVAVDAGACGSGYRLLPSDASGRLAVGKAASALLRALGGKGSGAAAPSSYFVDNAACAPLMRLVRECSNVAFAGWLLGYPVVYAAAPRASGTAADGDGDGGAVRTLSSLSTVTLLLVSVVAEEAALEAASGAGCGAQEAFSFSIPNDAVGAAAQLLRRWVERSAKHCGAAAVVEVEEASVDVVAEAVEGGESGATLVVALRALSARMRTLTLSTRWRFRIRVTAEQRAGIAM